MKLLVGLGNPEAKYFNTRHNIGYKFIDAMNENLKTKYKRKPGANSEKFLQSIIWDYSPFACLAKPLKYMNDSGISVKKLVDAYKLDLKDLYIVHDDLDIALGEYKIQFGKGPKVHNGIQSIIDELGTDQFGRIRIGIENRQALSEQSESKGRIPGDKYVLQDFTADEKPVINWTIQKLIHDEFFESLRYA
ncbi:MAG TPA: aminoacyl-tRNA hydrolase [Patescibacteria group bacterium]|nr:aminoacyl-tRNA hydrolase [Patescibacteria group bacterium]